jgi:hypothetical protein
MENDMAIEALAIRAEAADRRETARDAAHLYALSRADARRDTRVEEAQASAAARPTPSERAAEVPPRRSSTARLIDVLA